MRDPGFATPGSAASEQGKLCSRTVMRQANLMITTGRQLGFSPAGRQALGIEIVAPPVEHKPEDGWAKLRLISSNKNDERGD